ncbi:MULTISPECIES: hypothetical protein [unclassified Paenibacillus]|uniref:hypothetical protein n=1 Tax=unclassified Paenibacillus TaxID=185978 RepID=UPI001AE3CB29|nr:phenylpropionate dioxygenase-like ring-hydroxylating dioxygenase large terminal subunit [Paenibacillus sp. PvP091]MBP1168505.1 phenylpropionate dioxygenase-like ring-hydroxylating dioxygenase large terminal subunit [Paenibacillus sp. PvR098]MBP2439533.1 phenylpropionate dioxygenase-like ring-hydroxylating dioxygenase large terminal subunit [Paenibacillus sp. PvP052]
MSRIDSQDYCNDSKEWQLGGKAIVDIVVTHHARSRWADRIESEKTDFRDDITAFLWNKLKTKRIRTYYKNEQDVFLIDEDLVMVAEFTPIEQGRTSSSPVYKMIVVTFLGRMSENVELRDLRSYYSWLRHSRRMTLIKNSRKRR